MTGPARLPPVAVNYVADQSSAEKLITELTDKGHQVAAFRADVSDPAQTRDLVQLMVAEFGGLDILASNAGVEHFGALESITEADFDRVMNVNVKGAYNCLFAAIPLMKAKGGGVILNTASIAATVGISDRFAYSASKGAIFTMM